MALTHSQIRRFYDHFGKRQDSQWFYEDRALDELVVHAAFEEATAVVELGCGTGRFAERLLKEMLAPTAHYVGMDVSRTMVELSRQRLLPFKDRARVMLTDGSIHFLLPDHSVDRMVATYVFDVLSDEDMVRALAEAQRLLAPGGKLCLISLTEAAPISSRLICTTWNALYRLRPSLVGGCRPIHLEPLLQAHGWEIHYRNVVIQWGVPSEVVVATPPR